MRIAGCLLLIALGGCSNVTDPKQAADQVEEFGKATLRWADVGRSCSESTAVEPLSDSRRDSLPPDVLGPIGTTNRDWADAAREIPGGVGGIFQVQDYFFLLLVDPSKRAEAVGELAERPIASGFPFEEAQVVQARWDFAQLGDWYGYLMLKGVVPSSDFVSADIQEARNRLEFGVRSEAARERLESRLTSLGISCHLVAISIEQPATAVNRN